MLIDEQNIIAEFVTESLEGMSEIETDLLQLETAGAPVDSTRVNRVFRAIHSIKGASGFLGLDRIGSLTHVMENVLVQLRNDELSPDSAVIEPLLRASDTLRSMLQDIGGSEKVDVSDHVDELSCVLQNRGQENSPVSKAAAETAAPVRAESAGPQSTVNRERTPTAKIQRPGRRIYELNFNLQADKEFGKNPPDLIERLKDVGEVIEHGLDLLQESAAPTGYNLSRPLRIVLATTLEAATLQRFWRLPSDAVRELPQETQDISAPAGRQTAVAAPDTSKTSPHEDAAQSAGANRTADGSAHAGGPAAQTSGGAAGEANIRVSVAVLDRLMNLAGELVLGRNQLLQTVGRNDRHALEIVASRLDQVTTDLQESIMQTRMQPVGNVFNKFVRVVRDLSKSLGKQCDLEIEGKEVELDKTIIEAIGDPLTHLIRNAADHGIESPEARVAAGKPASGTIVLKAYHQEGKVRIHITDDGKGIDAARLKEKAVAKGIISAEQASSLSEREAIRLIFHPGFSTAEKITSVSGRGVGMDVVKTNLERIGGIVEVESVVGHGTTINITLPLTLAIIPSLIVHCGTDLFAIPQVNISELVRLNTAEAARVIEHVKDAEVLRLRGTLLPLVRLRKVLGTGYHDAPATANAVYILVVESGSLRYGLIIDSLQDSEEIVVKPLGRHMGGFRILAGGTILGDGNVALILDPAGIAAQAQLSPNEIPPEDHPELATQTCASQTALVFANAPGEQFAIPMDDIARIERISADQIEFVMDQPVLAYRGMTLRLLSLESLISARPRSDQTSLCVCVFEVDGHETGLIIPRILDIHQISEAADEVTLREPGVTGSLLVDGRTTRLLNLKELAELSRTRREALAAARWTEVQASSSDEAQHQEAAVAVN
jgi:two-component system, chemotaxis family, sensor kinase CheA